MRFWTIVWIVFIFACIGFTVYEIPNAGFVWRFSRASIWSQKRTASGELDIPAVMTDKLISADPEAADMLRYCLEYSRKYSDLGELASLAEKYPENEFFLAQLAEELMRGTVVDPKVALVLVDRLDRLNPDNAHYRYLRGWILLTDPNRPDRKQQALEQFELGHRLSQFYLPYSKYKASLDRLYRKAGLFWEWNKLRSFYLDLARRLYHSNGVCKRLDNHTFRDLSASVVGIADHVIENAYDSEALLDGATLLGLREEVRLKNLNLSEAEAQQSRYRMARGLALLDIHRRSFASNVNTLFNIVWMLWIVPILLVTALAFVMGIVLEFIQVRLGRSKPKVLKYAKVFILVDVGLLFILIPLIILALLKQRPEGEMPGFLVSVVGIFTSWDALGLSYIHPSNLARLRRPRLWLAFLCGSLWFKGSVFWIAGTFGASMPDNLIDGLQYGGVFLGWSLLCMLVWTEAAYRPNAFASKHRHIVAMTTFWVIVLMVLHVFGSLGAQVNSLAVDPLERYRPLPEATQETYERMILNGEPVGNSSEKGSFPGLPGNIGFATPKDVKAFITKHQTSDNPIPDEDLRRLLKACARDVQPIVLNALADPPSGDEALRRRTPNAYEVLVTRAEWGDRGVKDSLERIFEEKLAVFTESEPNAPGLGDLLELAGTLACVSEGIEGQDRLDYLLEYVVERTRNLGVGSSMTDPRHAERIMRPFWESLNKLPEGYATKLVKSYLRQTRYVDLLGDRGRDIEQLSALLAEGDDELAEEVVGALALSFVKPKTEDSETKSSYTDGMRLMQYRQRNSPYCLRAVFPHLGAGSIPLLLEYLNSDNDHLRAFIVWRLMSLGYEWPDETIEVLRRDIDWKVRLNALFAGDADDLAEALNDENAVVRIIANMLMQAQRS